MQKSKLRLVAWLFSHEVHSMIRLWKSSMLEHWKTLQEGWVNGLDTLYELFLILDDLLCKSESLNKYNTFSQLQKIESTKWFKKEGFFNWEVYDATVMEFVPRLSPSSLNFTVSDIYSFASSRGMILNDKKCKEMYISFLQYCPFPPAPLTGW